MNAEAVLDLVRLVILVGIFVSGLYYIVRIKKTTRIVFFLLAIASILLSDAYWLVYDIMRPEVRMPFAANEIGEWALFLLLGAALNTSGSVQFAFARFEIIFAFLFSAANVALWIGWSGEWIQDIITGIVFAYFICSLVYQIKFENAFADIQWSLLGLVCIVLIVGQTATFFTPAFVSKVLDLCCYILLFLTAFAFLVRAIMSYRKEAPSKVICNTFAMFAWSVVTMYMSSDVFFLAATVLSAIGFLFMFASLIKEAEQK